MDRLYRYVGSRDLMEGIRESPRTHIRQVAGVLRWLRETRQPVTGNGPVTATFTINAQEELWIADRHSEHTACARGQAVLSAGEMTFSAEGSEVMVSGVTNQSTGYCPEPESWPVVAAALDRIGLPHPPDFTVRLLFRRCAVCVTTNIIKEDIYECGVCQSPLAQTWNFGD